jgi:hypothetical protein
MTLGNAVAARVRLIVWREACGPGEPDPAEMAPSGMAPRPAFSTGASSSCAPVRRPQRRHGGDRDRAAVTLAGAPYLKSPSRPLATPSGRSLQSDRSSKA